VLAAGAGTRLRPLTERLPKPLAPVGGRPVVARLLDRLGDFEVALNVHHGAELVERVVGPGPLYAREEWLRGTAGALAGAADFLRSGDFLVVSGDGAHEVEIDALVARHRESGAAATITVKRIARPEACAVVALDEGALVRRFVEKPAEPFSDLASIGIYCFNPAVMDFVPADQPFDIAHDLIPALLAGGMPVAAYETDAWWTDIGDPAELLAANLHLAHVAQPSQIGPEVQIEAPAMIGPHSQVGARAVIRRALVLPGAVVPDDAVVDGSIHGSADDVLRAWLR
jgi:NDP-sugar pyrophosphorylase family protein